MELSDAEKAKYKFREIQVEEKTGEDEVDRADIHRNLVEDDSLERKKGKSYARQAEKTRQKEFSHPTYRRKKEKRFGWAFFLASLFIGLGITTVTNEPISLFVGLAVGFLFFVDPIYDKLMEVINRI